MLEFELLALGLLLSELLSLALVGHQGTKASAHRGSLRNRLTNQAAAGGLCDQALA